MVFFERENQCRNCYNECGWDEAKEILEDGTVLYEHYYECKLGNECSIDKVCYDCLEDK